MNEALVDWLMVSEAPDEPLTLDDFVARPAWHQRAACRGVGVERFIIKNGGRHNRAVCASCPVCRECLATALADDSLMGLWGNTTDAEVGDAAGRGGVKPVDSMARGGDHVSKSPLLSPAC